MLTYTGQRNLFGQLAVNTSTTNLSLGDTLMDEATRTIINMKPWDFRETSSTDDTVASQQFYNIPYNSTKYKGITVTIGSTIYTPKESPSRRHWDTINQTTNVTSNIPDWFYIFNKQVGFYPKPASATASAITHIYQQGHKTLSIADYTTGTITTTSTTSGVTTVTGSGTTWTASMVGRAFKIDESTGGDGYMYFIATVPSATSLTLTKAYGGTAISAGSATYTIGQVSILPEDYQFIPVWRALQIYFTSIQPEPTRAGLYKGLYDSGMAQMSAVEGSKTDNVKV